MSEPTSSPGPWRIRWFEGGAPPSAHAVTLAMCPTSVATARPVPSSGAAPAKGRVR
jgi:hypothetical protein